LIDLHCHILPGLDDGALDVEDSIAMARQAHEDGIEAVCATPHIRDDHDVRIDEIGERVRRLQGQVDAAELDVRIMPGGELAQARAQQVPSAELRLVTLGAGGRWLLLEPSPGPIGAELGETARALAAHGLQTLIAHPERHAGADLEQRLHELVDIGCLVQWTAAFITDPATADVALAFARSGLVHVLGSDAHSARAGRPVQLAATFASLASVCSAERIAWMAESAPRAIVNGDPVAPPPP
jgi:protein-tyrosine phosphatase